MSNAPTAEQKLKFAARIYKQTIAKLEKALTRAKDCGFPLDHIQRLEHMIQEATMIASFEVITLPVKKKKAGRPRKGSKTVEQECHDIFTSYCPIFIPLKVQEKENVDSTGKTKPQEGFVFNFSK